MAVTHIIQIPHEIRNKLVNEPEINHIKASDAFNALSGYQNRECRGHGRRWDLLPFLPPDLFQQFAPGGYADVSARIDQLMERQIAFPTFAHSVFTTAQINFDDVVPRSRKNRDSSFGTMEAITSLGNYEHEDGRGAVILWDDETVVHFPPGSTIVFPSGTKRFSFIPVALREERYFFRQYCDAGVFRWLDKGGRTDAEFEKDATIEEKAAWEARRENRAKTAVKLFSKVGDVYC